MIHDKKRTNDSGEEVDASSIPKEYRQMWQEWNDKQRKQPPPEPSKIIQQQETVSSIIANVNISTKPLEFRGHFELETEEEPIGTPEQLAEISQLPINSRSIYFDGKGLESLGKDQGSWIQTYSGRRFNPIEPDYRAIVLQDVAHALSRLCRFNGHSQHLYSVSQHSVLVSHICDRQDALWGLLHDASEAFISDLSAPIKHSGMVDSFIEVEKKLQQAICQRFSLTIEEPPSVKQADMKLLATEARDLLGNLHPDWSLSVEPLPFNIIPWSPAKAKDEFIKRFFELTNAPKEHWQYYLTHKQSL
jgi:uncharacterized protein